MESRAVWEYEREVDMRTAVLYRHACVDMDKGSLTLDTWRFVSMDTKELLAIRYQVTPSFDCRMEVSPYLDGNVRNVDANYDQSFWNMVDGEGWDERGGVLVQTKPNPYGVQRFTVAAAMTNRVEGIDYIDMASKAGYCAALYAGDIHSGTTVSVEKYVAVFTSRDHDKDQLMDLAMAAAQQAGGYYRAMLAGKLPELAQLAYERYNGERKTRLSAIDAMLDAADSRDGVTKAQIAALLDMDDADYDRADSKLQQQAKDAADRKAAADKKAKEEKAAQEAADKAARSEARRQITLILRNGGTVPNDLWEQSGYSAVTIAAMLRGRKG